MHLAVCVCAYAKGEPNLSDFEIAWTWAVFLMFTAWDVHVVSDKPLEDRWKTWICLTKTSAVQLSLVLSSWHQGGVVANGLKSQVNSREIEPFLGGRSMGVNHVQPESNTFKYIVSSCDIL